MARTHPVQALELDAEELEHLRYILDRVWDRLEATGEMKGRAAEVELREALSRQLIEIAKDEAEDVTVDRVLERLRTVGEFSPAAVARALSR